MGASEYEIRVAGSLGPATSEAFHDLAVDLEPTATVLSGSLDQAQLHRVLDLVAGLGLELIDIRQVGPPAPPEPGGAVTPTG